MRYKPFLDISRYFVPLLAALAGAELLVAVQPGAKTWTTSTFLDFVDGTLADGGVNTYVAADGTVRLINLRDLNNDGHVDIVLPNTHDNNAKVDVLIYWGKNELATVQRAHLPSEGGTSTLAAELNGDQYVDLVVVNQANGTRPDLNSFIYWGSDVGYDAQRRAELPTQGAEAAAAADLNGDGHVDLVFANNGLSFHVSEDFFQKSFIYWGAAAGFAVERRSSLKTIYAKDVAIGDLNDDGFPEIVFANEGNTVEESGAAIYWGSAEGTYAERQPTLLPGEHSSAVRLADLNSDGTPEVILANQHRLRAREAGIYNIVDTTAIDSYIYWGSRNEGYSAERRTRLPTLKATGIAIEDFNADDRPDVVFANAAGNTSYIYWNGPAGFRANHRTAIATQKARACAAGDINGDSYPDLVFGNNGDGHKKETDSYVYWGRQDGLHLSDPTKVPTLGATGATIAELDGDQRPDLVFAHREDGTDDNRIDSFIYWGDQGGNYSKERRRGLVTENTYGHTAADLDRDGHVDLYFSGDRSFVYHGGPDGFSAEDRTVLSEDFAFSGIAADFNRDGYLDLSLTQWSPGVDDTSLYWGGPEGYSSGNRFVFPVSSENRVTQHSVADLNQDGWLDVILPTWGGVLVFWNSRQGFDVQQKTTLSCESAVASKVADLDGDGHLDIVVANLFARAKGSVGFQSFGGDSRANTYVYWGSDNGYEAERRLVLPSVGNEDVAVADLNRDGHLDLVLSSYHAGYTRSHPSYVYWNGPDGFDQARVTMLPTDSAAGILVQDFNLDGHEDILFANHKRDGNHRCNSFLYWGSGAGFFPERRTELPGRGPHNMTSVDAGDIYQRQDRYNYVSVPHDMGPAAKLERLAWQGQTPHRTSLEFQLRTAATRDGLASAKWTGPEGAGSYFRESPAVIDAQPPPHRWIQYRASLVSTNSANSPVLESVAVRYSVTDL